MISLSVGQRLDDLYAQMLNTLVMAGGMLSYLEMVFCRTSITFYQWKIDAERGF